MTMSMAGAIEAKSLSSLTTLAENPPLRPQVIQIEPLTLYIARVPGSRDVFLTPLKPRQKIVTAEDVESSFYYLHVNHPDDKDLLESDGESEQVDEEENLPPSLPIRPAVAAQERIPSVLRPGPRQINSHPLPPLPPYPVQDEQAKKPTALTDATNKLPAVTRKPAPAITRRKPVGSSQLVDEPNEPPPALPVRPERRLAGNDMLNQNEAHITVIRRNPASGAQWNIGTIADPPVFDVAFDSRQGSMTSTKIRKSGQPLYLNITNPGYHKFCEHSPRPDSSAQDDSELCFHRRMWLEGSLFEKKASSHRKALSADHAEYGSVSSRPTFDSRTSSEFSMQNSHFHDASEPYGEPDLKRLSLVGDQKRSHTRGYTFMSPWNGRCEFTSGAMGNSLKCRHLISRNSLTPDAGLPNVVSELRFNLPGGGPMGSEPRQRSPPKPRDRESRRSRLMAKLSDRHSSEDGSSYLSHYPRPSEEMDDSKLDLSLGQELAGGGFAGKQAKLGKLIIEGEGLLMMDLLVTANMALWFRAYEKYQGHGANA